MVRAYEILASELTETIRSAVAASRDLREVCGVLVDVGSRLHLAGLPNISDEPCSFELPLDEVERLAEEAGRNGQRVVGTYHSHVATEAVPGQGDLDGAYGELMLIIDSCDEAARLWRIRGGRATEETFEIIPS